MMSEIVNRDSVVISSDVLRKALQAVMKVANTNLRNMRTVSLLLHKDPLQGDTKAYLGSNGWGFSGHMIHALEVERVTISRDHCYSFDVSVWKSISDLIPKGKNAGEVEILMPEEGQEDPSIVLRIPGFPEITYSGTDIVHEHLLPWNYSKPDPDKQIRFPSALLKKAFVDLLVAVAIDDEARPILTYIQLAASSTGLRMYASDGRRLSLVTFPSVPSPSGLMPQAPDITRSLAAVPRGIAETVTGLKNLPATVVLSPEHVFSNKYSEDAGTSPTLHTLSCGPITLVWARQDAYFPNFERTIPLEKNITGGMVFSKAGFLAALSPLLLLWGQGKTPKEKEQGWPPCLILNRQGEELEISLEDVDNMAPVRVPAEFFGSGCYPIMINALYLKAWLSVQEPDTVIHKFQDHLKASILWMKEDSNSQYVVMPMSGRDKDWRDKYAKD
jgi:hypothetical protein